MHKCPRCAVSQYKVKDDDECSSDESSKTLHGMQMGEIAMECFAIRPIPPRERRLMVYIRILVKRQEILGLDLPLME